MEPRGQAAIVTGGGSGLGKASVDALLDAGARVTVIDLQDHPHPSALSLHCDVSDESAVKQALAEAEDQNGIARIIVNCAGISEATRVLGKHGPVAQAHHERIVDVHLNGTFNVTRLAADRMRTVPELADGERGVVINTASIAAFEGQLGASSYASAKAGIVGLTLPLAREFSRYGIRVMAIAPGFFDTAMAAHVSPQIIAQMTAQIAFPKRFGAASEFAQLVLSICRNRMLNGETIRLDGGARISSA